MKKGTAIAALSTALLAGVGGSFVAREVSQWQESTHEQRRQISRQLPVRLGSGDLRVHIGEEAILANCTPLSNDPSQVACRFPAPRIPVQSPIGTGISKLIVQVGGEYKTANCAAASSVICELPLDASTFRKDQALQARIDRYYLSR